MSIRPLLASVLLCLLYQSNAQFDQCSIDVNYSSIKNLKIFAITIIDDGIIVGSKFAADTINNDTTILPNYNLEIVVKDTEKSSVVALKKALEIISSTSQCLVEENDITATVPLLLGSPWSSLTIKAVAALNVFSYASISSSATSTLLSDTSNFPYFYRTVPEDSLQSQGFILLCKHFGWDDILILHDNDQYGTYLAVGTLHLALEDDINARAIGYQREDIRSINNAINTAQSMGLFIIILIAHSYDLPNIFPQLDSVGMWGYPYFYIGCDGWFSASDIVKEEMEDYVPGYVGTVPWFAGSLEESDYAGDLREVYTSSLVIQEYLIDLWLNAYAQNPELTNNLSEPNPFASYGYDSMYALAHALHIFDERYGLEFIFNGTEMDDTTFFMVKLKEIMVNDVQFLGGTGNVTFAENGDRAQGLYSLSYIDPNGSIEPFGYFFQNGSNLQSVIKDYDIIWPIDFQEKGITPRSSTLIIIEISVIGELSFIILTFFICLSIGLVFMCVGTSIYYHNLKIIANESWKLNFIICLGCILLYISILLYGVDEKYPNINFAVLCNFRVWLGVISYTLIFMPIYLKTYRLSIILTSWINAKEMTDTFLYKKICVCIVIDLILLTIFTGIEPHDRIYKNGSMEVVDELQTIQYQYGVCSKSGFGVNVAFIVIIGVWKGIQLCYGSYVTLFLARIGIHDLLEFHEAGLQVLSIVCSIFILCTTAPILLLIEGDDITIEYAIVSIGVIFICNIVLGTIVFPRLLAIFTGNEGKYEKNTQQKMVKFMKHRIDEYQLSETSKSGTTPAIGLVHSVEVAGEIEMRK